LGLGRVRGGREVSKRGFIDIATNSFGGAERYLFGKLAIGVAASYTAGTLFRQCDAFDKIKSPLLAE